MNILIVGNGFDLSHYLPTKYDHFMDVMKNIEDFTGSQMAFDDLFRDCREPWFIAKTKEYYLTDDIRIESNTIQKIKKLLNENGWYKYFKSHVEEIKTWIDFEQKINEMLAHFCVFQNKFGAILDRNLMIEHLRDTNNERILKNLKEFDLIEITPTSYQMIIGKKKITSSGSFPTIKPCFLYGQNMNNGFNPNSFSHHIYLCLEEFIGIFNIYLELIVDKLDPKPQFKIQSQSWVQPDHIFSFNYTNSFQKFYTLTSTEFLHGRFGEKQNIVLGISDLEDGLLKKLKAYGFTKYHQKLFKDTDYLFLDSSTKVFHEIKKGRTIIDEKPKFFNFYVWGHSLDISDQEYVKDLFLFNEPKDQFVRITVFHFDNAAKFSLLNNLLAILGKDKVEQWMKNKWLTFEPNPEINFGV